MIKLFTKKKQLDVIEQIERSLAVNKPEFTVVEPVKDFFNDQRIALTSVHFPARNFIQQVRQEIIEPLRTVQPEHFYYEDQLLHMTIKNVRTISNPPLFKNQDVETVKQVFDQVMPQHQAFKAYYYRLLLFPYNLALIGTTDEELDKIIFALDKNLKSAGVPDNKIYFNERYFFSNVTLARFNQPVSAEFKHKVEELNNNFKPFSYEIDSVTLLTCNAVMNKRADVATYKLN